MQGKFEGIIILSDLDGTLLCRDHTICKRNREKIEYFKQNGGYFTFNTGRNYLNIYKNIPDAHEVVNAPIVSCNGACLYDAQKREPVAEHFIDPEKAKGAIRIQKEKYPDVRAEMSSSTGVFAESYDSYVAMDFPNRNVTILPLDEMRCDNWYKVVFRGEPCDLVPLRDEVIERFGAEFILLQIHSQLVHVRAGTAEDHAVNASFRIKDPFKGIEFIFAPHFARPLLG